MCQAKKKQNENDFQDKPVVLHPCAGLRGKLAERAYIS